MSNHPFFTQRAQRRERRLASFSRVGEAVRHVASGWDLQERLNGDSFGKPSTLPETIKKAVATVRDTLDQIGEFPIPPVIEYQSIRSVRAASGGTEQTPLIADGVIMLQARFLTKTGVRDSFDVPVLVREGQVVQPSVILHDGTMKVLAPSSVREMVARGTFTQQAPSRGLFTGPLSHDEVLQWNHIERDSKTRTRLNPGMFSVNGSRDLLRAAVRGDVQFDEAQRSAQYNIPSSPSAGGGDDQRSGWDDWRTCPGCGALRNMAFHNSKIRPGVQEGKKYDLCGDCEDAGKTAGRRVARSSCPECNGRGWDWLYSPEDGRQQGKKDCPKCGGSGDADALPKSTVGAACPSCYGKGYEEDWQGGRSVCSTCKGTSRTASRAAQLGEQPSRAHMGFEATPGSRVGDRIVTMITWDPDRVESMSDQNLQHSIRSFVLELGSKKEWRDWGTIADVQIDEFDRGGSARVSFKSSEISAPQLSAADFEDLSKKGRRTAATMMEPGKFYQWRNQYIKIVGPAQSGYAASQGALDAELVSHPSDPTHKVLVFPRDFGEWNEVPESSVPKTAAIGPSQDETHLQPAERDKTLQFHVGEEVKLTKGQLLRNRGGGVDTVPKGTVGKVVGDMFGDGLTLKVVFDSVSPQPMVIPASHVKHASSVTAEKVVDEIANLRRAGYSPIDVILTARQRYGTLGEEALRQAKTKGLLDW